MPSENFWSDAAMEPKRGFRFLVTLSFGRQNVQYIAKSVSRPSYTVTSTAHKFFNHTFHYPGRVEWGTVSLTLVDAITPNTSHLLYEHLGTIGYVNPTNAADSNRKTITKKSATESISTFRIDEMGADDTGLSIPVGNWKLHNAFITEANFGEHSYDSEDMIDVQLTIQYDWAQYQTGEYRASGTSDAE
tara:strand:+ start:339 stop:905 length:567 start_codon:yes stop_codon:yes gene_type:complete